MLPHLPGFDARPTATGYLLVPGDNRSGFIRYERRVRPLRPVSTLVAPRLAHIHVTERSAITSLFTNEGEHAARITLTGMAPISSAVPAVRPHAHATHAWMRRDFGVVFGDDFASIIDATCIDRAAAELYEAAVDKLTRELVLGAPLRRRRYRYTSPIDRTPRVRDLETDWISNTDTLTVFPAERGGLPLALAIAAREGLEVASVERVDEETTMITARSGPDDEPRDGASPDDEPRDGASSRCRVVVARANQGWLYSMELSSNGEPRPESITSVLACMASIQLLPAPPSLAPSFTAFEVE